MTETLKKQDLTMTLKVARDGFVCLSKFSSSTPSHILKYFSLGGPSIPVVTLANEALRSSRTIKQWRVENNPHITLNE